MKRVKISPVGDCQVIRLPKELRFEGDEVSVRREGEAIVLEPLKKRNWPQDFLKTIRIDDPNFCRPRSRPARP